MTNLINLANRTWHSAVSHACFILLEMFLIVLAFDCFYNHKIEHVEPIIRLMMMTEIVYSLFYDFFLAFVPDATYREAIGQLEKKRTAIMYHWLFFLLSMIGIFYSSTGFKILISFINSSLIKGRNTLINA